MSTESQRKATQIGVWSAIAGGAVGFALGMIFAPKRGPDARRRIAYQIQRAAKEAGDAMRRYAGSSTVSEARKNRDAMVADAQAQADHIRDDIDALLEELRKQSSASRSSSDTE